MSKKHSSPVLDCSIRLSEVAALPDVEAEAALFGRLSLLDGIWKLSYGEAGLICKRVQERSLWQYHADPETGEPCPSFTRWVRLCAPWSYAYAFAALRDVQSLPDVPDEALMAIPAVNFPTLKQLSTAVRAEPKVLEAAKSKRNVDFVEQIRQTHPEQLLEHRKTLRFHAEASAAAKIEEALAMAVEHGAANRNDGLELLAVTAIEAWRLEEEQPHEPHPKEVLPAV